MPYISQYLLRAGIVYLCIFSIISCTSEKHPEFEISNDSSIARESEPVVISREMIADKLGEIPDGKLPLPYSGKEALPSQVDDMDQDGQWDELAFTLNIDAGQTQKISIRFVNENELPEFTPKTNVHFGVKDSSGIHPVEELTLTDDELPVPLFERFQMDGPAWENDKIGFRQYIDGRNGRDLYGKKSAVMALDPVGISDEGELVDNYHVMASWGRDILAVGNSLGLGGIAILQNGEPVRLGVKPDAEQNNVSDTRYKLIKEGPVRSIFTLTYEGWNTGTQIYTLKNRVTIWAGKYGYTNHIQLSSTLPSDTLIIGLVNINNDKEPELIENENIDHLALFTHDKQTYEDEWYLGMALLFPNEQYLSYRTAPESGPGITNSYLALFELSENKSLEYHVHAGWEISDENFTDRNYFKNYVTEELQKISSPVKVD